MPGWGFQEWGFGPWGGAEPEVVEGENSPVITERFPAPGAFGVREDTVIRVRFYDQDTDLDSATTQVIVNGTTAYQGNIGFSAGYVGTVTYRAGSLIVQLLKIGGWGFASDVSVRGYIEDTSGNIADDTWAWRTRENPLCYSGLSPLDIEIAIQSPMTRFLDLEPTRKAFLDIAVSEQSKAITNRGNKAARVVYQAAFSTELSTLQNPYTARNKAALASTVCEKQNSFRIDQHLTKFETRTRAGIQSLRSLRGFKEEYIRSFNDYLDSTLYSYRVSLVANLILAARAIELQG